MAGNRTLKLSILADVDNLRKNLNAADNDVEGFGGKVDQWSKKLGAAFAAAGVAAAAYAGKLAIDGVKAAIEDEAAQLRLANALKNVTGATDDQIKSAESFILKTSLASGVADDQLRPALERLTRSVKSVEEAQKLVNLALDIAKAKNIDVQTAANALAKANDGQVGALKKLGITLGDNAENLKEYNKLQKEVEKAQLDANLALQLYGESSKEYQRASEKVSEATKQANDLAMQGIDIFGELGREFSGAASEAANTFQGKMDRLKIAIDETKETVGVFILNAVTPMVEFIVNKVIPNFGKFTESLEKSLGPAIRYVGDIFNDFFIPIAKMVIEFVSDIINKLKQNKEIFEVLGIAIGVIVVAIKEVLAPAFLTVLKPALEITEKILSGLITSFGAIAKAITFVIEKFQSLLNLLKNNPITKFFTGAFDNSGLTISKSDFSIPSVPIGPASTELFRERGGFQGNITVNGAISPIATARQIAQILGIEATTSGTFTNLGESFV